MPGVVAVTHLVGRRDRVGDKLRTTGHAPDERTDGALHRKRTLSLHPAGTDANSDRGEQDGKLVVLSRRLVEREATIASLRADVERQRRLIAALDVVVADRGAIIAGGGSNQ
jgi:hypothetical protein